MRGVVLQSFCYTLTAMFVLSGDASAQMGSVGATTNPQREVQRKKVEGSVLNSATGEPIRHALVSLSGIAQRSVFSDDEGRFAFDGLRVAPVMLQARKPGFFTPHDRAANVDLAKQAGAIELKLSPTAVAYGQILGADDEPLEQVPLQLFESKIVEGQLRWIAAGMKTSDQDGRFRFADLRPGIYKISAGPSTPRIASDRGYALTYYGDVPDRASAAPLGMTPALHKEINFKLHPVRVYKVSGMVMGGVAGGTNIQLHDSSEVPLILPIHFDPMTGGFEVMLPAGRYSLSARSVDDKGKTLRATTSITVGHNVEGLMLSLEPAISIPVIVRTELTRNEARQEERPAAVSVRLISMTDPSVGAFSTQVGQHFIPMTNSGVKTSSMQEAPHDDDSIVVQNVEPGAYEVTVSPNYNPGRMYIASVQCGNKNLLREPLKLTSSRGVDPIEIVLRDDGALLEGSVREATSAGPILIISEDDRMRRSTANFSPDGRLFSPPLAPGSYTFYAFDHSEDIEFLNPEVLRKYESKALHVVLTANQTTRVTLDQIETEP